MNVALGRPMVLDEFLDWERGQELRFEFDGLQPLAMTEIGVEIPLAAFFAGLDLSSFVTGD